MPGGRTPSVTLRLVTAWLVRARLHRHGDWRLRNVSILPADLISGQEEHPLGDCRLSDPTTREPPAENKLLDYARSPKMPR